MKSIYPIIPASKLSILWSKVTCLHIACIVGFVILIRMSVFWYTQDVGIEVDGGWYLGVSRILAEKSIYASYTNYSNSALPGASPTILRRFTVQDADGYSYFPAGVTVGPAYVLPQVIVLKIFGNNYFAYKIFPFATTIALMFMLVYLTGNTSGKLGGILIGIWLWARPDLYANQSLENFGESLALLYIIVSLLTAIKGWKSNKDFMHMLSGIFFGLAILTKPLVVLAGGAFLYLCIRDVYENGWSRIRQWGLFGLSFLLPIIAFEGYRYLYMVTHFGYSGYVATNSDFYLHFIGNGSGAKKTIGNLETIFLKSSIWTHLNMIPIVSWAVYIISLYFCKLIKEKPPRTLSQSIWFGAFGCFSWYIFVSPSGWFRHAWFGIMLSLPLIVIVIVHSFQRISHHKIILIFGIVSMLLVLSSIMGNLAHLELIPRKSKLNEMWGQWRNGTSPNRLQGPIFAPIFSWKDQKETLSFIVYHIPPSKNIYYERTFTVAEMSTLSDRVFFPVFRYLSEKGTGYLILGPYQKGFASYLTKEQHDAIVANYCDKVVFSNPSYTICHLYEISAE